MILGAAVTSLIKEKKRTGGILGYQGCYFYCKYFIWDLRFILPDKTSECIFLNEI